MIIHYDRDTKRNAQLLRKNMTRQERHLWHDFLKCYPVQFRRQKQFGRYIVDFYCASAKLAVELDGSQHFTPEALAYDAERTRILTEYGLFVLRFTNDQIDRHFNDVCSEIDRFIRERSNRNI